MVIPPIFPGGEKDSEDQRSSRWMIDCFFVVDDRHPICFFFFFDFDTSDRFRDEDQKTDTFLVVFGGFDPWLLLSWRICWGGIKPPIQRPPPASPYWQAAKVGGGISSLKDGGVELGHHD